MSREAVTAFLREVANDPDLQKELVAFAAKRGYEFTPNELNEADLSGITGGVLSDVPFDDVDLKKKPAKK